MPSMKQMPAPAADDSMDDLYKGGDMEGQGEGAKPESIDQENAEEMSKKAVVPMSVLMGKHTEPLKVGDEVVLKVTGIHGDEAEVEYSETPPGSIGKEEGGYGGEGEGMGESANDELDRLGKEY